MNPIVAEAILEGNNDAEIVSLMMSSFPGLLERELRKLSEI